MRVVVLFGTRPEVIKLAPVILALRRRPDRISTRVVSTGQHREMVQQALDAFGLVPDVSLDVMQSATSLGQLTARLFQDLEPVLVEESPDWLLVQGDTTSAMAAAMSAFYRRIRVGHVEAGLRTHRRFEPFPEEVNRRVIGHVTDIHFAPTQGAADNLLREGVPAADVHVTGNTGVDALLFALGRVGQSPPPGLPTEIPPLMRQRRTILVTGHRRESFGAGLENICRALLATVERYPDALIVYPVHLNPQVREPVHKLLGGHERIRLIAPVGYLEQAWLMRECFCIFTDSGGIQEEAPTLGKPVLIMRERTERPEVVDAGCARLVGTNTEAILEGARLLFEEPNVYRAMSHAGNPFGDGRAGERIVEALLQRAAP